MKDNIDEAVGCSCTCMYAIGRITFDACHRCQKDRLDNYFSGLGIIRPVIDRNPGPPPPPQLDLSFWSFLTVLHHGIEDIERHLL